MEDRTSAGGDRSTASPGDRRAAERDARRAAALRANLRRRKAQSRARNDGAGEHAATAPADADEAGRT
jgi:hypothetical protein